MLPTLFRRKRSKLVSKGLEKHKKFSYEHRKSVTTITYRQLFAVYQLEYCLEWSTTISIKEYSKMKAWLKKESAIRKRI